ncbi:P-loop containing nucleoside triphosphate hydrolase protein [Auricularia subglabra TFB-10046 SS5]|nr:P-loop containing nucleoside triphosphate hydrolase protein [Auricularia subglabra TFB-10046 SS5]
MKTQPSTSKAKTPAKRPLAPIFAKRDAQAIDLTVDDAPAAKRVKTERPHAAVAPIFSQPAKHEPDVFSQPSGSQPAKRTAAERMDAAQPLAARLRPSSLAEFVGHTHLLSDGLLFPLKGSVILWGPPGCGKTTLARILAGESGAIFKELSATSSGAVEARSACEEAKRVLRLSDRRTVLFLDEIHRFNKAQQDVFLPYIEAGHIQLIGATTENPAFKLNGALLSRCRVLALERLTDDDIDTIITRALDRYVSFSQPADTAPASSSQLPTSSEPLSSQLPPSSKQPPSSQPSQPLSDPPSSQPSSQTAIVLPEPPTPTSRLTPALRKSIVALSAGDSRTALSLLELVLTAKPSTTERALLQALKNSVVNAYDRSGDARYEMISALHKSVRGSDGSAALYWLARMLDGGEDPLYVARRLIVMASEDIGLADDACLPLAIATHSAVQLIGLPEARINLAHCVARLALAPKSTRAYEAYGRAEEAAKAAPTAPVPVHLRNATGPLLKELGWGRGYAYNPGFAHPVWNEFLPVKALEAAGVGEQERQFLRDDGDKMGKTWDEDLLEKWEWFSNGGKRWEGRPEEKR